MNVTHQGHIYEAREINGAVVLLDAPKQTPAFICSQCGEGGQTAEQIQHKPTCPLYAAPARKTA